MARTTKTIRNTSRSAVSRGGYTFPARQARTVELTDKGVAEVRACRWLVEADAQDADTDEDGGTDDGGDGGDESDLAEMTVDELRALARERGVDSSGRKADLVARLEAEDG